MAPPYRIPVWEAMAEEIDLTVHLLASEKQFTRLQRSRNRSAEWIAPSINGFTIETAHTFTASLRGRPTYALRQAPDARPDCVVLGGWEQPAYFQLKRWASTIGARRIGFYESTTGSQRHTAGPIAAARRRYFRDLDAIVAPGSAAASAARQLTPHPTRVHRAFNPVDIARFARPRDVAGMEAGTNHRFLYVGQLIDRKNIDALLHAFSARTFSEDLLTIAGKGSAEVRLKALSHELGISHRVAFIGAVPNARVAQLMWNNHTLVLPSTEEVWGLVVNEALTAGLHAVSSRHAGVTNDVQNMPGVFATETTTEGLRVSMAASKKAWRGPISQPPILQHTPQALAKVFTQVIEGSS